MLKFFLIFGFCAYGMESANQEVAPAVKKTVIKTRPVGKKTDRQNKLFFKKETQSAKPLERLIEKLEFLKRTLPKNHKAGNAINLRLAHILSLKAENDFVKAEKGHCPSCRKSAQSSAKRSLSVYKEIDSLLETRHPLLHTEALFKQAYLHRLFGEKSKSLASLKRIVMKKEVDPSLVARAWFNMGEIYFELYDYQNSLQAFNNVLKQDSSPWEFKSFYRKIWSLFNLSLYEESIHELESFLTSDLYSDSRLSLEDQKLRRKLENELVALYSYAKITDRRLNFLYGFSKQDQSKNVLSERNKRLFHLARDLKRIGRMDASNKVWRIYISRTPSLENRLKAYSFMISNDLSLNIVDIFRNTGQKVDQVFSDFERVKVSKDLKQTLKERIKAFFYQVSSKVSSFSEGKKKYLLDLYQKYNAVYPGDLDILSRSAFLARDLKNYNLAQDLFQVAVLSIKDQEASKTDIRENMCLLQMEMAELTKNVKRRLASYDFYIQHGRRESLIFKARYQKSYISYENKNYKTASDSFHSLALYRPEKNNIKELQGLRLKSAHLSLSTLDQMGNQEEELAHRAGRFMEEFPENRKEFTGIYHAALLNTVKKLVAGKDFSKKPVQASLDKDILKAWEVLHLVSLPEAAKKEALTYHFDRLLLAKELLKFDAMKQSLGFLLSDRNLKKEDFTVALTWKLWLAELRFDFKEVLRIIKILKSEDQSEEHLLRLARLAELADQNPFSYYEKFVEKFPHSPSATAVLVSMVEKSSDKNKKMILRKYASLFKNQPDMLTYWILKVDEGRWDEHFIRSFIVLDFMKNTSLDSFLRRKRVIESFEKDLAKVSNYSLSGKVSGYRLNRTIKIYRNKINKLGDAAERLLKPSRDLVARIFIISHWKEETSRFYNSIMRLPLPKSLTEDEKKQYVRLLQEQLQPYNKQITQLKNELKSLWSRDVLSAYMDGIKQDVVFHGPLKWEMEKLVRVSAGKNKKQIQLLLSSLQTSIQTKTAVKRTDDQDQILYEALRKDPFDKQSLMQLLELEKSRKNKALSYYLVNRIKELKRKNHRATKL